jgi:hypothetical protein
VNNEFERMCNEAVLALFEVFEECLDPFLYCLHIVLKIFHRYQLLVRKVSWRPPRPKIGLHSHSKKKKKKKIGPILILPFYLCVGAQVI